MNNKDNYKKILDIEIKRKDLDYKQTLTNCELMN